MKCPKCKGNTVCSDSRDRAKCRYRRRMCQACSYKFSTAEIDVTLIRSMLIKEIQTLVMPKLIGELSKSLRDIVDTATITITKTGQL